MIKGQKVLCSELGFAGMYHNNITVGKVYSVTAGKGNILKSRAGEEVADSYGFEVRDDDGDYIYISSLVGGLWGDWEVVE